MKRNFAILFILFFFNAIYCKSQSNLIAVDVKNINGSTKKLSEYIANDGLTMICFWKTCCKTNTDFLSVLNEIWIEEEDNINLQIVLVSVDDARSSEKVRPYVRTQGWEWETLIDPNSELARTLNVVNPPYVFLINPAQQIVYKQKIIHSNDAIALIEKIKNGEIK